jgi:hypothetical protein
VPENLDADGEYCDRLCLVLMACDSFISCVYAIISIN